MHRLRPSFLSKLSVSTHSLSMLGLASLCLASLCLVSCADVLGLDGLSYDQGQTKAEPTGGTGPLKVDEPLIGSGGGLPIEEYKERDFPALWPDDSMIVTLPASLDSNYYWVYRPSEHLLYSYELNFTGVDLLGRQAWPEDVVVSHLVAVPSDEGPALIAYDSVKGWTTRVRNVLGAGELEIASVGGSKARTHVFVANHAGEFLLVVYDAVDGAFRYIPADTESEATSGLGKWEPGWTHLQPYSALGKEGILFFNATTLEVSFRVFGESGAELEEVFSGAIDFAASNMVTLWQGTTAQIAFYDAGAGVLTLRDLVDAGEEGGLAWGELESGWKVFAAVARLPEDLTFLAPVDQSPAIMLGFNGTTAGIYSDVENPSIIK